MCTEMIEDHDRIRDIAAKLRPLLIENGMPIGRWFASSRWALTRHLLRHLAVEADILRREGRALLGADPFEERYRRHIAEWTPDLIDSDWPRYCRELNAILDALDRRMDFEDREFYGKGTRHRSAAAA